MTITTDQQAKEAAVRAIAIRSRMHHLDQDSDEYAALSKELAGISKALKEWYRHLRAQGHGVAIVTEKECMDIARRNRGQHPDDD